MTACDHGAKPILLISDLAEHTTNLATNNRASLLFDGTVGLDNPLTGARVTVLGTIARTEDPFLKARYMSVTQKARFSLTSELFLRNGSGTRSHRRWFRPD